MVKYLEKTKDFDDLIKGKVLVDFYADWCGPCKREGEVLEKIDFIDVVKVNVDEFEDIAKRYGIMSIPTIILFNEGKEIRKEIGFRTIDEIKEMIK